MMARHCRDSCRRYRLKLAVTQLFSVLCIRGCGIALCHLWLFRSSVARVLPSFYCSAVLEGQHDTVIWAGVEQQELMPGS
jgi:hypothetical protein